MLSNRKLIYQNPLCREPIATIMPTRSRTGHKLAPSIPSFSSRGPYLLTRSILKVKALGFTINVVFTDSTQKNLTKN